MYVVHLHLRRKQCCVSRMGSLWVNLYEMHGFWDTLDTLLFDEDLMSWILKYQTVFVF